MNVSTESGMRHPLDRRFDCGGFRPTSNILVYATGLPTLTTSRSFTYRVLAYRARHWVAIEMCRRRHHQEKDTHDDLNHTFASTYTEDEEWPRQTSGHGLWWFILVLLSRLTGTVRAVRVFLRKDLMTDPLALLEGIPDRALGICRVRLAWPLRHVEHHRLWNEESRGNVGRRVRRPLCCGCRWCLRVMCPVASDSYASCGLEPRPL